MIFWSKTPKTKKEKLEARQKRDRNLYWDKFDKEQANQLAEDNGTQQHLEEGGVSPDEGLDEDLLGKVGRKKQQAQTMIHEASKKMAKIKSRKKSIGRSRSRSRKKGKSLGF